MLVTGVPAFEWHLGYWPVCWMVHLCVKSKRVHDPVPSPRPAPLSSWSSKAVTQVVKVICEAAVT